MPRTVPLHELADIIRSKNAGPYRVTLDILFGDPQRYRLVRDSGAISRQTIAAAYRIASDDITSLHTIDMANAIKVTLRRRRPQGAPGDSDMYGCQQHAPLIDLPVAVES